jgi:hypothetical protein
MQVSFAAMLGDASHAALEDRKEAFNRVGMNDPRTYSFTECVTVSWLAKRLPVHL